MLGFSVGGRVGGKRCKDKRTVMVADGEVQVLASILGVLGPDRGYGRVNTFQTQCEEF